MDYKLRSEPNPIIGSRTRSESEGVLEGVDYEEEL